MVLKRTRRSKMGLLGVRQNALYMRQQILGFPPISEADGFRPSETCLGCLQGHNSLENQTWYRICALKPVLNFVHAMVQTEAQMSSFADLLHLFHHLPIVCFLLSCSSETELGDRLQLRNALQAAPTALLMPCPLQLCNTMTRNYSAFTCCPWDYKLHLMKHLRTPRGCWLLQGLLPLGQLMNIALRGC